MLVIDPSSVKADLERGDLNVLAGLKRIDMSASDYSRVELYRCDSCTELNLITIKNIKISYDKDGNQQKNETMVVENLLLTEGAYKWAIDNVGI